MTSGHPREAAARRRLVHRDHRAARDRGHRRPPGPGAGRGLGEQPRQGRQGRRGAGRARPRARHQGDDRPRRADRAGAGRDRARGDDRRPGVRGDPGPPGFVEAGINVVSSGPVILLYPDKTLPTEMVDDLHESGRRGEASLHVNGIDPGFANDVLPLVLSSLSQRIDHVSVSGDRRLLDVLPAGRDERHLRLRQADGPPRDAVGAGHPEYGVGPGRPADRRRASASPWTSRSSRRSTAGRAERDVEDALGATSPRARWASVRFQVIGTVDGVPRITLDHVTRTDASTRCPSGRRRNGGRRLLPGRDHRRADDAARLRAPRRVTATTTSPG